MSNYEGNPTIVSRTCYIEKLTGGGPDYWAYVKGYSLIVRRICSIMLLVVSRKSVKGNIVYRDYIGSRLYGDYIPFM